MYRQATGTRGGAVSLLILMLIPLLGSSVGTALAQSRAFWALARDRATPFSETLGKVNDSHKVPANAIIFVTCFDTVLGAIYAANTIAFDAISGSFAALISLSYLMAIFPFLLGKRRNVKPGPFYIKGIVGYAVAIVSCIYLAVMIVFYMFSFAMPVTAAVMNYTCVIFGAMVINATPRLLQPLTGASVGWCLKYLVARCLNKCLPVIKERLDKTAQMRNDASFNWQAPVWPR